MLSAVLKTEVAEEVSVSIMDAFVAMRKYISSNLIEQNYINNLVLEDHENIKLLQESFSKFEKNPLAIPLTSDDGLRVEKENNIKLLTNIHLCAIVDM